MFPAAIGPSWPIRRVRLRLEARCSGTLGYRRFESDFGNLDLASNPIAIVGPNEVGKTSFLRALCRLNNEEAFSEGELTRHRNGEAEVRALFALDEADRAAIRGVGGVGRPVLFTVYKREDGQLYAELKPPLTRNRQTRKTTQRVLRDVLRSRWWKGLGSEDPRLNGSRRHTTASVRMKRASARRRFTLFVRLRRPSPRPARFRRPRRSWYGDCAKRYLSFAEREEIAILCAQRVGVREIARRLGRSASTISRELRRNASTRGNAVVYRSTTAQWHAERRASRPKVSKLGANDALREYVQDRLAGAIGRPNGEVVPGPEVRFIGRRQHRFVWGVRLVLLTDERGLPLGYTIVPANEKEYEPLADLLTGTPAAVVIADKGLWGRDAG